VGRQLNNFETLKKENELSLVFKNGRTIKSTGYVKATYLLLIVEKAKRSNLRLQHHQDLETVSGVIDLKD